MSAATEERATAAHAIRSARSRGLHGRAALADAYQSLTAATALILHEGNHADARRWEKASSLVFDRWVALDEPASALAAEREPSPYCAQHHPHGSADPCGPCGVARRRHAIWRDAVHEFDEDIDDASMCTCGLPAQQHDEIEPTSGEGRAR